MAAGCIQHACGACRNGHGPSVLPASDSGHCAHISPAEARQQTSPESHGGTATLPEDESQSREGRAFCFGGWGRGPDAPRIMDGPTPEFWERGVQSPRAAFHHRAVATVPSNSACVRGSPASLSPTEPQSVFFLSSDSFSRRPLAPLQFLAIDIRANRLINFNSLIINHYRLIVMS